MKDGQFREVTISRVNNNTDSESVEGFNSAFKIEVHTRSGFTPAVDDFCAVQFAPHFPADWQIVAVIQPQNAATHNAGVLYSGDNTGILFSSINAMAANTTYKFDVIIKSFGEISEVSTL